MLRISFILSLILLAFTAGFATYHFAPRSISVLYDALRNYDAQIARDKIQNKHLRPAGDEQHKARVTMHKLQAYDGVTLITRRYSETIELLGMNGDITHSWHVPFSKYWPEAKHIRKAVDSSWVYAEKAHLFNNGDLLLIYTAAGDTPYGYGMVKVNKDAELIWKYSQHTHHDFEVNEETGEITALIHRFTTGNDDKHTGLPKRILEDYVVTLSPEGREQKRISILDAFRDSPYALLLNDYQKNNLAWDRMHTNAVSRLTAEMAPAFPQFAAGDILLSLRNMDTVAVLDPTTAKIKWASNGLWRAQHSPKFLSNGTILLFDNKGHAAGAYIHSRILAFNPQTLAVDWHYTGGKNNTFYSALFGRVQRLPNGNTLITDSMNGRIIEITATGEIVWELKNPILSRRTGYMVNNNGKKNIPPYMEEPLEFDSRLSGMIISATRYNMHNLSFMDQQH